MNQLTVRTEKLSIRTTFALKIIQLFLFCLALMNFILIAVRLKQITQHNNNFINELKKLTETLPQAVLFVNSKHTILFANTVAERLFKKRKNQLIDRPLSYFLEHLNTAKPIKIKDRYLKMTVSGFICLPDEYRLISLLDITESLLMKEQSLYDPLTGVLNRRGLEYRYLEISAHCTELCCLFVDLDKFKNVNDTCGHSTGDEILKFVAKRLKSALKAQDLLARYGGDEFVIIIGTPLYSISAKKLCERLKATISNPIVVGERVFHIEVSIGATIGHPLEENLEEIISKADQKMYLEKSKPRPAAQPKLPARPQEQPAREAPQESE